MKILWSLLITVIPEIPQHIADAIERAMSINSNDRFATVEEFWQALEPDTIVEEEPLPSIAR